MKTPIKTFSAKIIEVTEQWIAIRPGFNCEQMTIAKSDLIPQPKQELKVGYEVEVYVFNNSGKTSLIVDTLELEPLSEAELDEILKDIK